MTAETPLTKRTGPNDWQTPDEILDPIRELGVIGLDPCTTPNNPTGAKGFYSPGKRIVRRESKGMHFGIDGLKIECSVYTGEPVTWDKRIERDEIIFCNPPFGRREGESRSQCYEWIPPTIDAARAGAKVVFLSTMSQRVEVMAFQELFDVDVLDAIFFPCGRVRYVDPETGEQAKGCGQWPTMLFFYNFAPTKVAAAFGDRGVVVPVGR